MLDLDLKKNMRKIAMKRAPVVHPTLTILDLTGVRPTDIARQLNIAPPVLSMWRSGQTSPSEEQIVQLTAAAAGAIAAAVETLGETAADHPELVGTDGFKRYAARVAEARRLFTKLTKGTEDDAGVKN